jgi:nucleoside 2-deoxyribosyltransferase
MIIVENPRVLKIYLAGYMSGSCLDECLAWRKQIREHYGNWKGAGLSYPVVFLDPFNGPELNSISKDGLKSEVPPKGILMGDYMSVKEADLIIVNWDTFGHLRPSIGTPAEMAWAWQLGKPIITIANKAKAEASLKVWNELDPVIKEELMTAVEKLPEELRVKVIEALSAKIGDMSEHPFIGGFTTIFVDSVEELLNSKHINYFYKRVNHANYE